MRMVMDDLRSGHETFRSSSGDSEANHFSPAGVVPEQLASNGSARPVGSHPEMITDCNERSEKALGLLS
jgi:hypothetical protein